MNFDSADTRLEVATRYRDMLLARTASDRVVMACEMFDLARATVLASLPADADDAARRVHLFVRIYEKDFDPDTAALIITRLASSTRAPMS